MGHTRLKGLPQHVIRVIKNVEIFNNKTNNLDNKEMELVIFYI